MVNPHNTFCCLNPNCPQPLNHQEAMTCMSCNTPLTVLDKRYRPIKLLGEGGVSRTYLAENIIGIKKKNCILKQLTPKNQEYSPTEQAIEQFHREAEKLEELAENTQINRLLNHFQQDNYFYLVQQYVNGQTLEQLRDLNWTEVEILDFLKNILPVLQFIHDKKVIHQDINPQNIIYSQDDGNYILMGLSVSQEFASMVPLREITRGTRGYAAYELMESGEALAASDLFSIGAICFYLLTKIAPDHLLSEEGEEWVNSWQRHLPQPISPLLTGILDKLLQKESKNRYQSAKEVLESLHSPQTSHNKGGLSQKSSNKISENQPPSHLTTSVTTPSLSHPNTFTFKTVKLDPQGHIIQRETRQGELISFDLGEGITLDMVRIPAGTFIMGSPPEERYRHNDEQQRKVVIKSFYLGKYPVTQAQWQAIMGNNPSRFQEGEQYPVESVSWHDCQEFCQKISQKTGLTFRLPAEAEWEYACRAGTTTPFYFGETLSTEVANYTGDYVYGFGKKGNHLGKTTELGSFPANGFGLYDIHGNVWEWCQDDYQESPVFNNDSQEDTKKVKSKKRRGKADPNHSLIIIDQDSQYKLLRGGSWGNGPSLCRCAFRSRDVPSLRSNLIGFRVVVAKT